jgi:hypothetical protein
LSNCCQRADAPGGWKIVSERPHESTFSRAFAQFARSELPQMLHRALIEATQTERLTGHILRDSTAIEVSERFRRTSSQRSQPGGKNKP